MSEEIKKVAVLGAGVMGAQLAGHLANAGIPSLLFDINQDLAEKGLKTLTTLKPAPLYKPKNTQFITPCNYDDHLPTIQEADWIIEAVAERLDIKHKVYQNILPHLKDGAILTSNTSGLPLSELVTVLPEDQQSRFMITHFFNPPRYMRLVEFIRGPKTSDTVYQGLADFCESVLGKGIVHAKDTPNFIGNRIGIYGIMLTIQLALDFGLTVEEVDKLTGTIVGRPKSATFRTADVVGLDVLAHVAQTTYERCLDDPERDIFQIPEILQTLLDKGQLGQKTRAGFYRKEDKTILSLDLKKGTYGPQKRVRFDGYRLAKDHQTTAERIKALTYSDDQAGRFFWELVSRTLLYTARLLPEISDDIVNVDNAMKWGFGWELGPFETWDAIGVLPSIERMEEEGKEIPAWVKTMVASGRTSFYEIKEGKRTFYDLTKKDVSTEPLPAQTIYLNLLKSAGNVIQRDWSASLIDLGDGILNVEFHSILQPTLNPIDGSITDILNAGLDLLEAGKYRGLVMGHQGPNFCAGANLNLILALCEAQKWTELERAVKTLQDTTQRIRFSPAPVVAAPFHMVLGGGVELVAPAAHRVAAAETYMGLVEAGVGLIPGAGGNLRLILNAMANAKQKLRTTFPIIQKVFETIGFAKVSSSADEAKHLNYLLRTDTIVLNRDQLLWEARNQALQLAEEYAPPTYRDDLKLPGRGGRTAILMALKGYRAQGKISAHDEKIGQKLAYVLTGGDQAGLTKTIEEQQILDLEREAFISLAGEPLTQDRIRHMLKTGKPLRN
jgi:3-hydroxyacyl-CoA dehydrogenase